MQPTQSALGGLACRISGTGFPFLEVVLDAGQLILFSAEAMLWKDPGLLLAAQTSALIQAEGPGACGLGLATAGAVFPIPLARGQAVEIRAGHFLLSMGAAVERDHIQGLPDRLAGDLGLEVDRFTAGPGGAIVWVQATGDVFERWLLAGEPFDVRTAAFLCKDEGVSVASVYPTDDPGARFELRCLRFTGPGRVAFQTACATSALVSSIGAPTPPSGPIANLLGVASSLRGRTQG